MRASWYPSNTIDGTKLMNLPDAVPSVPVHQEDLFMSRLCFLSSSYLCSLLGQGFTMLFNNTSIPR